MKNRILKIIGIIIGIILVIVVITNIMYNLNEDIYGKRYSCCEDLPTGWIIEYPCGCKDNIFEKTLIICSRYINMIFGTAIMF